jgi:hypothetical protein
MQLEEERLAVAQRAKLPPAARLPEVYLIQIRAPADELVPAPILNGDKGFHRLTVLSVALRLAYRKGLSQNYLRGSKVRQVEFSERKSDPDGLELFH